MEPTAFVRAPTRAWILDVVPFFALSVSCVVYMYVRVRA